MKGPTGSTFNPSNEPYLGSQALYAFDKMIVAAMDANKVLAPRSHSTGLSALQLAAVEIIPHGFSLALSIRELVRQGYLLSAEILIRPLLERAAVLSYLCEDADAVDLWRRGWPYKTRPSLGRMLSTMGSGFSSEFGTADEIARLILSRYNAVVHADPSGARLHASETFERPIYSAGKSLDEPERCDAVCRDAATWLAILVARACQIFPGPMSAGEEK